MALLFADIKSQCLHRGMLRLRVYEGTVLGKLVRRKSTEGGRVRGLVQ